MTLMPDVSRVARALLLARDAHEILHGWLEAVQPDADLVLLAGGDSSAGVPCFQREGTTWRSLDLPRVLQVPAPDEATRHALDHSRVDALDDVLVSIGVRHALRLPLDPPGTGLLALGRSAAAPFRDDDAEPLLAHASLLGHALVSSARRIAWQEDRRRGASREVAELFVLTRALATALSAAAATEAARSSLAALLAPRAGAVVLEPHEDEEPAVAFWPRDEMGAEAASRARSRLSEIEPAADGEGWLVVGGPADSASIVLTWSESIPTPAPRIAMSVLASLSLASHRFAAQRMREESRLAAAVERLPLGVALVDASGRVRLVNPMGRKLLAAIDAWSSDEACVVESLGGLDLRDAASETAGEMELEVRGAREERTIVARVFPQPQREEGERTSRGSAGEESSLGGDRVIVLEDVTEAKRQHHRMHQIEKLSSLGTLISGIVHEINNPLATILGYADLLQRRTSEEPAASWLSTLRDEAARCRRIVRDMLDVSRPSEAGRRVVQLGPIVEKAVSLVAPTCRAADIEIVSHAAPRTPGVHADPDAVLRCLLNLMTNAIHALESWRGPRRIEVGLESDGKGNVALTVRDSGPGVPPEHQDKLFDPFFTTKLGTGGTGLGLSLVAATVRDHGGSIELSSALGRGACLTVSLPAASLQGEQEAERNSAKPRDALGRASRLARRSVLIAEDDPELGDLLVELLAQAGARPRLVRDGREALEVMLTDPPDLLLCDLHLPALDGAALLSQITHLAPELATRVVFATGDASEFGGRDVFEVRGRPCLGKPFELDVVIDTLSRCLPSPPQDWPGVDGGASPRRPRHASGS